MDAMHKALVDILTGKFGIPAGSVTDDVTLTELQLDSLALLEMSLSVEESLGITLEVDELVNDITVADTVA